MLKLTADSGSVLAYGELLWDLLPSGKVLGGAAANFALRLHELGAAVKLISAVGDDQLGRGARQILRQHGLDTSAIQCRQDSPTGTVIVKLSSGGNPDFEIVPEVAYDRIELETRLLEEAARCRIFYFGTLIQRAPLSQATLFSLLEAAPQATKLLDVNLRRKCYSSGSILRSLEWADIVKLSESEAPQIAEILRLPSAQALQVVRALIEQFNLEACILTLGEQGLYALNCSGEQCYSPGFETEVSDLVGAGDACTAGFCAGLLGELDLKSCAQLGNTLGALSTTRSGGLSAITPAELLAFENNPPPRLGRDDLVFEPCASPETHKLI